MGKQTEGRERRESENPAKPVLRVRDVQGLGMAGPALAGLLVFVAVPFVMALILSGTNLRMGSPLETRFVGIDQYLRVLGDEAFRRALVNNSVFALVVVPLQTALALGLALLLHRKMKGRVLFRTLFFMPVVFPMALVAVVWQVLLAPGPDGLLNSLLGVLSFGAWVPRDFLRDPHFALPAIMLMSVWQGVGFQMVIMLAGRQGVPEHLYEAAAVEGAGSWRQFLHVTLPGMRNTIFFVVVVTTILAFRLFDQVDILTQGGPQNATTTVMYEAVRTTFAEARVARGAAMTVIFFLIVVALAWAQRKLMREEREIA